MMRASTLEKTAAVADIGTNLTAAIVATAQRAPDAVALIDDDNAVTYRHLHAAICRAGAQFAQAGWTSGSVVGTAFTHACPAVQVVACVALARRGIIQLPLHSTAGAVGSSAEMLARHRAVGVLTDALDVSGGLPALRPGQWLAEGAPVPAWETLTVGGDAPWIIVHSSGTTGTPKAMAVTHAQAIARSCATPHTLAPREGDRFMSLVSPRFTSGMAYILQCLRGGGTVVAAPRDSSALMRYAAAKRHGVTHMRCTPSQLHDLLVGLPNHLPSLDRLRALRVSTAAVCPELLRRAQQRITPNVFASYGCSETGNIAHASPDVLVQHPLSVGRASFGVEVEVVGADGIPLPPGCIGEIRVRTHGVVIGYIDNPEATQLRFRDGWYYPGDAALIDCDGLIFLKGRTDELLNFDGVLVAPQEIESALLEHQAVVEAAAFAVPSARFQDLPCAAVVLREQVSAQLLAQHCKARIGWRTPHMIVQVRALPRNAMGKVLRRVLSAEVSKLVAARRVTAHQPNALAVASKGGAA
jgi:acyl-coenzyme A synthetase/AMP-(fatty) acid ligase